MSHSPRQLAWKNAPGAEMGRLTLKEFSEYNAYFYFAVPRRGQIIFFAARIPQLQFLLGAGVTRQDIYTAKELQNLKWLIGAAPFQSWTLEDAAKMFVAADEEECDEPCHH